MSWENKTIDTWNALKDYTTSNAAFVSPLPGYYFVTFSATINTGGTGYTVNTNINLIRGNASAQQVAWTEQFPEFADPTSASISTVLQLNAGDKLTFNYSVSPSGNLVSTAGANVLSIFKLPDNC